MIGAARALSWQLRSLVILLASLREILTPNLAFSSPSVLTATRFPVVGPIREIEICDREATRAARIFGISRKTLKAIGRVESGLTRDGVFAPWPWTINVRSKGLRFRSKEEAVKYASALIDRGVRSFDVGCFQLNYRWHGSKFEGLEEMFSPRANAEGAARYLVELFQEYGTWREAVGAYHSRTRVLSEAYVARVMRAEQRIEGSPSIPAPDILPNSTPEIAPFSRKTNLPLVNLRERTGPLF